MDLVGRSTSMRQEVGSSIDSAGGREDWRGFEGGKEGGLERLRRREGGRAALLSREGGGAAEGRRRRELQVIEGRRRC